ncbi:CBS domain-containing protein [Azospirillum brasilense]|uniref:CBS domain-containing protein n=1 Tax=Azospirillum brasilense TaxID=192 RepID=A0A4D8R574_AZOBR|nr:CBS domain-containing protein [Azospirillum brasilense]QCO15923.1 CBS domain-containing protein [Azospirillum brasilense]
MTAVAEVLNRKGHTVASILPSESIRTAARALTDRRIGALVVCDRRGRLAGILSERDIVRAVAMHGADALDMPVEDLMTRQVKTCRPEDTIKDVMQMMTLRRHRHVPVCNEAGDLAGVISIGDAVKARLDEQAHEVAVLKDLALVR